MPITRPGLTPRSLAELTPSPDRDYAVPDLLVPGLWFRIYPNGTRTWVVRLRASNGKRRQRALGDWPTLSLDAARTAARVALGELAGLELAHDGRSFRAVMEEYLDARVRPGAAPRTLHEYERQLRTVLYPALGARRLDSLEPADLLAVLRPYHGRPLWNRLLTGLLRPVFKYACARRYITNDPTVFLSKVRETPRSPHLTVDQVAMLNDTLSRMHMDGRLSPRMTLAFRLVLATGARLSEVLCLRWDFLDTTLGNVTWPTSKTGIKRFPLTPTLQTLLAGVQRVPGSPFVLAHPVTGAPLAAVGKAWRQVRVEAGLPTLRIHDLRHVFGTRSRQEGDVQDAQALLAHRQIATTLRYTHPTLGELATVAEATAQWMLCGAAPDRAQGSAESQDAPGA